jgi:hypothetical protein
MQAEQAALIAFEKPTLVRRARLALGGWNVERVGEKFAVVRPSFTRTSEEYRIGVYSLPEDMPQFRAAVESVEEGGPASALPGAIFSVTMQRGRGKLRTFGVLEAQFQYGLKRRGKGPGLSQITHQKYKDARRIGLVAAFNTAFSDGLMLAVPYFALGSKKRGRVSKEALKDLLLAKSDAGGTVANKTRVFDEELGRKISCWFFRKKA